MGEGIRASIHQRPRDTGPGQSYLQWGRDASGPSLSLRALGGPQGRAGHRLRAGTPTALAARGCRRPSPTCRRIQAARRQESGQGQARRHVRAGRRGRQGTDRANAPRGVMAAARAAPRRRRPLYRHLGRRRPLMVRSPMRKSSTGGRRGQQRGLRVHDLRSAPRACAMPSATAPEVFTPCATAARARARTRSETRGGSRRICPRTSAVESSWRHRAWPLSVPARMCSGLDVASSELFTRALPDGLEGRELTSRNRRVARKWVGGASNHHIGTAWTRKTVGGGAHRGLGDQSNGRRRPPSQRRES